MDGRSPEFRKWVLTALMTGMAVLLSPLFSFPLGVTRAFPLQHMINIFLAVLCGTRCSTSAAFCTSVIRNLLGTGSILAFPGSMIGAFLSGFLYQRLHTLWAAVLGEFVGTSLIGGLVSYPLAALFLGSSKGALFYVSLFSVSCGAGCAIAYGILKSIHLIQTEFMKSR
ncbi:energy coupling factor transporter S component ThiW [Dialister sp.]|uniref:energy coupling factor transporter S component ThiW n=1 Tax=Dialister sp. TaxID=1955814 RepID=UPI003F0E0430